MKKDVVIMHPGPMNRGVEIDSKVADSDNAVILDQVLNGVASRMSILYLLLGEGNLELWLKVRVQRKFYLNLVE